MRMQAGAQDIFGDTSEGVPSPLVPHVHPYPTRYHGPIFNQPYFGRPYRVNEYALAPYAGFGDSVSDQTMGAIKTALDMDVKNGAPGYTDEQLARATTDWIAGDVRTLTADIAALRQERYLLTAQAFQSRLAQVQRLQQAQVLPRIVPERLPSIEIPTWYKLLSTASMAASAYHGYKRNESVGWAIWWGFMGAIFPVLTPTVAVAQGYGEPAKRK